MLAHASHNLQRRQSNTLMKYFVLYIFGTYSVVNVWVVDKLTYWMEVCTVSKLRGYCQLHGPLVGCLNFAWRSHVLAPCWNYQRDKSRLYWCIAVRAWVQIKYLFVSCFISFLRMMQVVTCARAINFITSIFKYSFKNTYFHLFLRNSPVLLPPSSIAYKPQDENTACPESLRD